jgi:hypothetical protein
LCSCIWFTIHAMPCHATTMPFWSRHSAACEWHQPFIDSMWVTCPHSASSGYHTEFHESHHQKHTNPLNCRISNLDISGCHAEFHEGCYQKHTNPLNCRTSSSDVSGYHTDFHKGHGTIGQWQGAAWQGMAEERHGHGMACVN